MSNYRVFRMDTCPSSTDEFGVGRTETWTLRFDRSFTDLQEAMDYVVSHNMMYSELPRFLVGMSAEQRQNFITRFCFGDSNPDQRYFLGQPDITLLQRTLEERGVRVRSA